jgi:Large-conductance mechanosensitive channel, MscL
MKGFKQFLLRGNVLDLAVAVVIGAAFGAVVTALVKDLVTPLIAAIVGNPDFSAIAFTIKQQQVRDRRFHQCRSLVSLDSCSNLLFRSLAREHDCRPHETWRSAIRSNNQEVSGMPERCADCSAQMRILHVSARHPCASALIRFFRHPDVN